MVVRIGARALPALSLLAIVCATCGAVAQQATPAATRPPDPALVAAQTAFEALPETDRRAIQLDLTFATRFNGAAAGSFGPLTFNAIKAFEGENGLSVDGILQPAERQALAAAAQRRRTALRFTLVDEARSGVRIGVPQNLLPKREAAPAGGARFQSADGKVTLETITAPEGETLAQLFVKATDPAVAGRKITYRLQRSDFFVVTGETERGKFFRRMAMGPEGKLRGFAIGYDKAVASDVDQLVIAIANSFDPFPGATATVAPAVAAAPTAVPVPSPPTAAAATPTERLASGLAIAGGHLLTSAEAMKGCRVILAGPRRLPARLVAEDAALGLALLAVETGPVAPLVSGTTDAGAALVAFGHAWRGTVATDVFVEALPASDGRISAPLQPGGAGAALFSTAGAFAGMVVDDPAARRKVAGVTPPQRYRFISRESAVAFAGRHGVRIALDPSPPSARSDVGDDPRRAAVRPIYCQS